MCIRDRSLDFVGPFPPSHPDKYVYLFTIKDTFTKWIEAFPVRKANTITVIHILQEHIFSRFGKCERLHSDQGTQFTSHLFQEVADILKIQVTFTPAYNPKSNPVERVHRDLKAGLMALTKDKPNEWVKHLSTLLYACRNSISSGTGFSPFQLMFGRDPIDDLDVMFPSPSRKRELLTNSEFARSLAERIEQAHHWARVNMGPVSYTHLTLPTIYSV